MEAHGIEVENREVTIRNARDMADEFYERGFSLAPSPTDMARSDFFEHDKVVSVHYNECEELLKQRLGAKHVLAFDYIVRSIDGKRANIKISGGSGVQGVASGVHADYTLNGAPRRLVQLSEEPRANDVRLRSLTTEELARATRPEGRWCIVNVWRNIRSEPLEKTPLALLDCTSVEEGDFCCVEQRMVDRTGENYIPHFNPKHKWYYFPQVERNEAVLIKAWDSKEGPANTRCSLHGAFKDPSSPPDAPERESIEVRCVVIF
jgi:hypothetical protein